MLKIKVNLLKLKINQKNQDKKIKKFFRKKTIIKNKFLKILSIIPIIMETGLEHPKDIFIKNPKNITILMLINN